MPSDETTFCPDCARDRNGWATGERCREHATRRAMMFAFEVLGELEESATYWSEYDVPIGIVDRVKASRASLDAALKGGPDAR